MAEYIEREALVYELKEEHEFIINNPEIRKQTKWREALCYNRTLKAVYKQPAADVVEVVHGEWLEVKPYCIFECSNCEYEWYLTNLQGHPLLNDANYCPNCGAKMDAERKCEDDKIH